MRVLILEDNYELGEFIANNFKREGFSVDLAETGERGFLWGKVNDYDLGVFDIRLAGRENGTGVVARLRESDRLFPVIMISVEGAALKKVEALDLGADDYLAKPFLFAELLARSRALLRRERILKGPVFRIDNLELDTKTHSVKRGGRSIELNRKEFSLLEYMMRNEGVVLTRSMILEHVWDMNADPFTNTVDVHIRFLRSKIDGGKNGKKLLKTVHGYGYKIEAV